MLPAMAEPTKFLAMLHSTILLTVVLRTDETVFAAKIASTCKREKRTDNSADRQSDE